MKEHFSNENISEKIRLRLIKESEPDYKLFASSLIPGCSNMLGVRIPKLRNIAKTLAKEEWKEYFKICPHEYFEETMLHGLCIGYLDEPFEICLEEIKNFIPYIDNWSVCDSFCSGLKIANKYPEEFFNLAKRCLKASEPFSQRFGLVMLIDYFVDYKHIEEILDCLDGLESNNYYVKMAEAWLLSSCYVKFKDKVLEYLSICKLDNEIYDMTIRKICESQKVSREEKLKIKTFKRKKTER